MNNEHNQCIEAQPVKQKSCEEQDSASLQSKNRFSVILEPGSKKETHILENKLTAYVDLPY